MYHTKVYPYINIVSIFFIYTLKSLMKCNI